MKIYIGADHAGFDLKEKLKIYLNDMGYEVEDKGAFKYDENDDYPDFIKPVAEAVVANSGSSEVEERRGIILGGSGQGEAMCANKVPGVRASVFYGEVLAQNTVDVNGKKSTNPFEIVLLERLHNDANILSLGVRFITEDEAKSAIKLFLDTKFSAEERHIRRINKF